MSVTVLRSPKGTTTLRFLLQEGRLLYQVNTGFRRAAATAPIGIRTREVDFTGGLTLVKTTYGEIHDRYTIPAFKKEVCPDDCHTVDLLLEKDGHQLLVQGRAYDDGAAFRMQLLGEGPVSVIEETCGFCVPEEAHSISGMKLVMSYEDHYHPIPFEDLYQNNYAFPMLCDLGGGAWALYAEAAVFGDYGGSNLLSSKEQPRMLMVKKCPDQLWDIPGTLPLKTPWRVVLTGTLSDIVESNTLENLNPPSIVKDPSFIRPGRCAWSWMTENLSPTDPKRQREYVDYAAAMGFEYSVDDGGWPGNVDIPELVRYADTKGVKIWIWEHSADMRDPKEAEEKMKLWSSWGVVGLKIDFFESDAPERVKQYEMLAELAAKYRLMLNFHGCMKPSGFSRCWPHVMSCEAVMGGEYLQNFSHFLPGGPDAAHHCTLPFTRNVMGPMDFTPVVYNSYLTGTTDPHQTALTVIFTSYVLHIGESAENVMKNPCRPFLEKVKTAWDETRLLEGAPGSYVTMARRSGKEWFVGAICARRPRNVDLTLDWLEEGMEYQAELYADDLGDLRPFDAAQGALPPADEKLVDQLMNHTRARDCAHQHDMHRVKTETFKVKKGDRLFVPLNVNGGFAMVLMPKP
ncbi:MAG: glycoside hydrolase family 97 protein [Clostridia bacterium]|nr:glycoside hydrolase family 97 protein [Clostridia bacterium]